LALPPAYGAAEICSFVGPFLEGIREMRLVRRDDRRIGTYSVLLGFDSPKSAAEFYKEFDGKPVISSKQQKKYN
jgi:BRCA1-associated protein 2